MFEHGKMFGSKGTPRSSVYTKDSKIFDWLKGVLLKVRRCWKILTENFSDAHKREPLQVTLGPHSSVWAFETENGV